MPYSFTQIEKDKTQTIGLVFSFLIVFYFFTFWLIATVVMNYYNTKFTTTVVEFTFTFPSLLNSIIILLVALVVGFLHWHFSVTNIVDRMLGVLNARPPDRGDVYHDVFCNVVEEVIVATGGKHNIEPVVIPTMAMNAFALQDFKGRAVIGVTEGVVSRLSRSQLEAVVGHEAAHIVSGDCLHTTVISSIFELYSGMLYGISLLIRGSAVGTSRRGSRDSNASGIAILLIVYALLAVTKGLGVIVRMFISRQREYRADAIAVRLTRNPLALAEALYAVGYHWRGAGLTAENMEAIFIVSPKFSHVEEAENMFANLFSTHPPFFKRINILLNMAHENMETMMNNVAKRDQMPKAQAPEKVEDTSQWNVNKDGQWLGPFGLTELATFSWISPDSWIKKEGESVVKMAHEDSQVGTIIAKEGSYSSKGKCPKCGSPMNGEDYEGVQISRCSFCQGTMMNENDVRKIVIRKDYEFSDRIKRMADNLHKDILSAKVKKTFCDPNALLVCSTCRGRMLKRFYTYAYKVEVDHCMHCQTMFFEKDELEVLQCMIEQKTEKN